MKKVIKSKLFPYDRICFAVPIKATFFLLMFICKIHFSNAQIAHYELNTNIEDTLNNHHATSFGNPSFSESEYISLDPEDYLLLPNTINDSMDISKSLQFNIRFKVEGDYESTPGEEARVILSSKYYDQRIGGFDVTARQWEGKLRIITTYGDGIDYEPGECPSCGLSSTWSEGKLDFVSEISPGTWYDLSIKFILDRDVPYIQYVVNNTVSISYFDERVDFEGFRGTLDKQSIWVGSDENNNMLNRDEFPKMSLDIDYLTISSPIASGDQGKVADVVSSFIDEMNGELTLTQSQTDSLYTLFVQNWDDQSYSVNKRIIDTYIATYAKVFPPIFTEINKIRPEDFPAKKSIQFIMEQWMLDNQYGPDEVTTMEGLIFEDSEIFPGSVDKAAPRLQNATFTIAGDYQTDPGFYLNDQEFVIRPTGYYAAPGELVTVSVPTEAIDKGLTLYVGAHNANVQLTWNEFSRFPRVSTNYDLTQTEIIVANPFGGALYVTVPDNSQLGPLTFEVDGAVKAPYYCTKQGFENELVDFLNDVNDQYVPWVDLESDNFMTTITAGMAASMNDVNKVINIWDASFDALNFAIGRPTQRFRSEYIIHDRQSHAKFTAAPASYPMSLESSNHPYNLDYSLPIQVERGSSWYKEAEGAFHYIIFHEYGHLHNMPTLPDEQESNVNMPAAAIYNLVMGESIDSAFVYSNQQRLNLDQAALDWMLTPVFYEGLPMGFDTFNYDTPNYAIQMSYQSRGHAKWVDLANLFGWEALGQIMGYFYELKLQDQSWDPYGLVADELIEVASKEMGFNMAPFFEFWGVIPSSELRTALSKMPVSYDIRDRISHYRTLIPADNNALVPLAELMIRKLEYNHDIRYEAMKLSYNDSIASRIRSQIDFVLCRYYENCNNIGDNSFINRNFSIYPNPATDQIFLRVSQIIESYTVNIFTVSGKLVYASPELSEGSEFNLSQMKSGLYFISIETGEAHGAIKFIKHP